jgi:hypothetical protein
VHIAEVRANLPKLYHRILPTAGANTEIPRIYDLASALATHTDFVLTADGVTEAIEAYQASHLLTMAELWLCLKCCAWLSSKGWRGSAAPYTGPQQLRELSYFWANRLVRAARAEEGSLNRILAELQSCPMRSTRTSSPA